MRARFSVPVLFAIAGGLNHTAGTFAVITAETRQQHHRDNE